MAQKIQTRLIDDLDGSEAESTVRFGVHGIEYEIDLSATHADELRRVLTAYAAAAPKVATDARRPGGRRRRGAEGRVDRSDLRAWAKGQGIEVKDLGRVPSELVVKFRAATGQ